MSEERKKAVALRYDEGKDDAPIVVASGEGRMAEQILALAKEHGIAVQENPTLVEALAKLDLGEMIPAELYPVVAEVLVWVQRVDGAERERSHQAGTRGKQA